VVTINSPQLEIFNAIFKISHNLGFSTYDYLPAKETNYPFVYLGEQFDVDVANKSTITGIVTQRIHIYHDYKKRGDMAIMINELKTELRKLNKSKTFHLSVGRLSAQMIPDNSTAAPLIHGILEVDIKFN